MLGFSEHYTRSTARDGRYPAKEGEAYASVAKKRRALVAEPSPGKVGTKESRRSVSSIHSASPDVNTGLRPGDAAQLFSNNLYGFIFESREISHGYRNTRDR